jgi:serine/threonine protein kinase
MIGQLGVGRMGIAKAQVYDVARNGDSAISIPFPETTPAFLPDGRWLAGAGPRRRAGTAPGAIVTGARPPMRLSTGTRFGTFEILAPLGAGGMGEVYRARDTRLKRDVAVKVLLGSWADTPDRLARFEREAELLAALNHPNIAAIYGVEEDAGVRALVLELVEGPTLADRLAPFDSGSGRGPLPVPEALAIARQIIDALDAAHEKGIVHRDLKPANIKVRDDGTVKVLDFGLAKALEPDAAQPGLSVSPTMTSPAVTSTGVILGTAAYMSPEQARGQTIDKRTDIWAFGCVLYEMLAGRIAFDRPTVPDTVAAILEREPDWSALPPSTPVGVRRLLLRCLDKNRSRRLRDIADARHSLDEVEDDASRSQPAAARTSWPTLLAGAAIVATVAAVAAVLVSGRSSQATSRESSTGPRFRLLTPDAAFSTEPALSRDGTMVVYASDRNGEGQLDLWLQRTSGGQPISLTADGADDRQPDFSPDGSLIAFRSDRAGGGVYVMPALGGNARLVAEGGRRPRFSPDGSRIAYWTGPWLSGNGARGRGCAVFTVPANGGQPTALANGFWTARDPVWAPDGQSVVFFGRKTADDSPSGAFDWWWAPLDGREPVPTGAYRIMARQGLSEAVESDVVGARQEPIPAIWTGAGVIFSAPLGASVSLWRLQVSPATGQADGASLERLTSGAGFDQLATADDAGRVVFQSSSDGYVSLTLGLDSNAGRPSGPIVRQTFWAGQAGGRNSLDESGRLLVYQRTSTTEGEIWVKDLQTGQERHLVTAPSIALNPVISHDGTRVAYSVQSSSEAVGYVVPTSGGAAREVCRCVLYGWFSDSRRILALDDARGLSRRIRVIDVVDGTEADLLRHQTATFGRADISPDGRWLSFGAQRQIWIAPVRRGSPPEEREWVSILKAAPDSAERACGWSPDGRLLYLLLERDGFRDLYAQRIDTTRGTPSGEPFVVQHLHDPRRRWGSTPFGTAIVRDAFVFSQVEMTGSIWLMEP